MNRDVVSSIEDVWGLLPESFPGQYPLFILDDSHKHEVSRDNCERIGYGRVFIHPNLALNDDLIKWVKRLENVKGWRVFASKEHLNQIGPPFDPNRRGVDF